MATSVADIITRVRVNIADTDEIGFTDSDLIGWINAANRFLRRLVIFYKPMLLVGAPYTTTLASGSTNVTLPSMPMKIIDVRVDGVKASAISIESIDDTSDTGTPEKYYLYGLKDVYFYPVANKDCTIKVIYVPENTVLTADSEMVLPNDFDDQIIEYTTIRAQLRNEFDMTQEMSIMSTIVDQVQQMLSGVEKKSNVVTGYFGVL
jgi:hypothetical protein